MIKKYDLVGDIHGNLEKLINLFINMGYKIDNGLWIHEGRIPVFVGDFIDRGPQQRELIQLVSHMCSSGAALAVMGNHEFNAISYFMKNSDGCGYLREHSKRNYNSHKALLDAYKGDHVGYAEAIKWMKNLPLFLELDGIRVVHACWKESLVDESRYYLKNNNSLEEFSWHLCHDKSHVMYDVIETLLKGPESTLPKELSYKDENNILRNKVRISWWQEESENICDIAITTSAHRKMLPNAINFDSFNRYQYMSDIPVFFGHYWFTGDPKVVMPNMVCLDYSAAKDGYLVAYRWDGEKTLSNDKFITSNIISPC